MQCKTTQCYPFLIKSPKDTRFLFNRMLLEPSCPCCGSRVEQCGPMWIGDIHDTDFVKQTLSDVRTSPSPHLGTRDRIDGFLSVISEVRPLFSTNAISSH